MAICLKAGVEKKHAKTLRHHRSMLHELYYYCYYFYKSANQHTISSICEVSLKSSIRVSVSFEFFLLRFFFDWPVFWSTVFSPYLREKIPLSLLHVCFCFCRVWLSKTSTFSFALFFDWPVIWATVFSPYLRGTQLLPLLIIKTRVHVGVLDMATKLLVCEVKLYKGKSVEVLMKNWWISMKA